MHRAGPNDQAASRHFCLIRAQAFAIVDGCCLLPPPLTIRMAYNPGESLSISMADGDDAMPPSTMPPSAMPEFVSVTGCLRPDVNESPTAGQLQQFRQWSCEHPQHPLASRFQILAAWLAASRVDRRFHQLVRRFVAQERRRQQRQLFEACQRLVNPAAHNDPRRRPFEDRQGTSCKTIGTGWNGRPASVVAHVGPTASDSPIELLPAPA